MENVIADNVTIDTLCGCPVIATDCIGGVHYEIVKLAFGAADAATQVSACDPLPILIDSSSIDVMLGTDFSNVLGTASLVLGTQADNVANTSDGVQTTSFLYGFDGTTWDRLHATAGDLHIHDGGNSITVDGSLTVDLGCNNDVTVAGDALTALQLIDDVIYADDADWSDGTSKHALVGGLYQSSPQTVTDGDVAPIQVDSNGNVIVQLAGATLPAGTNNIGDVDVLTVPSPISGPGNPTIDSYTHASFNLAAGANNVLASSAACKQIWVYGFGLTISAAGTVSFQDECDTAISGIMPLATNSGMIVPPSGNFAMPLWKLATNKDLEVDAVTGDIDGWVDYAVVSV